MKEVSQEKLEPMGATPNGIVSCPTIEAPSLLKKPLVLIRENKARITNKRSNGARPPKEFEVACKLQVCKCANGRPYESLLIVATLLAY